jgi:cellulose biosynthesis protein BcsQ
MGDATVAEIIQDAGGVTIVSGARGLSSMDMILGPQANREYRLKEAQAVQQTIFAYAPNSYGAQDYLDFTQEFLFQSKKERKNAKK